MANVNKKLLSFFSDNHKPGTVGLVGTDDVIGLAIRAAQGTVTQDYSPSLWSHCFILGEARFDLRGLDETKTRSPYIFESDLKVKLFKPQLRNGAQENWIGKWCVEKVEHAAVIDFGLSAEETEDVLAAGLQLVDEQVLYPIQELLGTWWAIITARRWEENPIDDPHAMYCSSFVRFCYRKAGHDFISGSLAVSNTAPEDIARAGIKAGAMKIYKP